jgi:hypothetical protein
LAGIDQREDLGAYGFTAGWARKLDDLGRAGGHCAQAFLMQHTDQIGM